MASFRVQQNSMPLMRRLSIIACRHHQQFWPIATEKPLQRHFSTATENLPRAAQPSIWQSVVPKAFRKPGQQTVAPRKQIRKDWNPATFFIVIFLLIGSNAIQMIVLRNEFINFSRKADAKIGLLKEVIERVQKGEDVDVEGLLGTGNEEKEREWEEVVREIEEADRVWEPNARRRKDRRVLKPQSETSPTVDPGNKADMDTESTKTTSTDANLDETRQANKDEPAAMTPSGRRRGFY